LACRASGSTRAIPHYSFIGASKAALESLARALAQELGFPEHPRQHRQRRRRRYRRPQAFPEPRELARRVRASAPRCPAPLTPEHVADAVYLLCLPEAALITRTHPDRRRRFLHFRMTAPSLTDSGLERRSCHRHRREPGHRPRHRGNLGRIRDGSGLHLPRKMPPPPTKSSPPAPRRKDRRVSGGCPGFRRLPSLCGADRRSFREDRSSSSTTPAVIRDNLLGMLSDDDIRAVLQTNVEGVFNMCRDGGPVHDVETSGQHREHQFRFRGERRPVRRITQPAKARSTDSPDPWPAKWLPATSGSMRLRRE